MLWFGKKPSYIWSPGWEGDTQHNGYEHLAINNTLLRRLFTRLALRTSARCFTRRGVCVSISSGLIVKRSYWTHLTEAATMQFIAENTSIPVPKVYCSFIYNNIAYTVMERVKGEAITKACQNLSEDAVKAIYAQLRAMIDEMRALTPPAGTGVESCVGGSLHDSRILRAKPRFGPFKTIQDFHFWSRNDLSADDFKDRKRDEDWYEAQELIRMQDGPWPPPVFTHGDLNPSNILVHEGKVVSIIDWEFAGWYPHYWEYSAAWYTAVTFTNWRKRIDQILDSPGPDIMNMEASRIKWFGG